MCAGRRKARRRGGDEVRTSQKNKVDICAATARSPTGGARKSQTVEEINKEYWVAQCGSIIW